MGDVPMGDDERLVSVPDGASGGWHPIVAPPDAGVVSAALGTADFYGGDVGYGDERDVMSEALAILAAQVRYLMRELPLPGPDDVVRMATVPSFVHLGGDVWVNPAHVVEVSPHDGGCAVGVGGGMSIPSSRSVLEVLALLTDEAEL
jgi:hypothetical protein